MQRTTAANESLAALAQLTQVLERSIEAALTAFADALAALLARTLQAEQRRTDFQATAGDASHIDAPTAACAAVTSLVRSVARAVATALPAAASASLLSEVRPLCTMLCAMLCVAMAGTVRLPGMESPLDRWMCHAGDSTILSGLG